MLALVVLLASSTSVVDVPCKKSHDGYRCGDVEVHVDAHYATPVSAGHEAFRAKNPAATARSEHDKGTDVAVDIAGKGSFKVFANRKRDDDVVVEVTCDVKAADSDAAWSKCSKAVMSILFASGKLPSSVIDRVETLWDLDHASNSRGGKVRCKGNDKAGSCDALALKWGGAVDAGDPCVALGWPATCKPGDKGSWLARTAAGISFTCADVAKCGFLFGIQPSSDAPASGGATAASASTTATPASGAATSSSAASGASGGAASSSGASSSSSATKGASVSSASSSGANGGATGANGASSGGANGGATGANGASSGGASAQTGATSEGGSGSPEAGTTSVSLNAEAEKSLVEWDKAYDADPKKAASGYASAAWRAAEEARVTDRGLALGLARVVEHVDPTLKQARFLDDELAQKHMVRSLAELVGGGVVAVGGAVGGMALFSNKDQTLESAGVILGLIVAPPAVATAIIGGVGTYDELTKDIEPRLPKGLEHRHAWLAAPAQ
jgi:hypothetical protein